MELTPEELLLAALLRRAIKDAQGKQERVREEAARWLWTFAPTIAERAKLPTPNRFMKKDSGMVKITVVY